MITIDQFLIDAKATWIEELKAEKDHLTMELTDFDQRKQIAYLKLNLASDAAKNIGHNSDVRNAYFEARVKPLEDEVDALEKISEEFTRNIKQKLRHVNALLEHIQ